MSLHATQIQVSERVKSLLSKSLKERQLAGHFQKRMSVIYKASFGRLNQDIADDLKCSMVKVRKWRDKWKLHKETLFKFEAGYDSLSQRGTKQTM